MQLLQQTKLLTCRRPTTWQVTGRTFAFDIHDQSSYHKGCYPAAYICSSPIAKSCGVESTEDPDQVAHWEKLGAILSERLGHPVGSDSSDQQRYIAMPYLESTPRAIGHASSKKRPFILKAVAVAEHEYISTTFLSTYGCECTCNNINSRIQTHPWS